MAAADWWRLWWCLAARIKDKQQESSSSSSSSSGHWNPDRIEGKLVAINPLGLRPPPPPHPASSTRRSSLLWLAAAVIPADPSLINGARRPAGPALYSSPSRWPGGRSSEKRSPKLRCCPRASGSTRTGCTAPGSAPKASQSPTCWAWSRTCRRDSSPVASRDRGCPRAPGPGRSRRARAAGSAGSPSRGGHCPSASASCAAWRRSSPPGRPASSPDICRCCRPGPTATTCRTWRPRGTPTPVRSAAWF